jgi:hypothetical protein
LSKPTEPEAAKLILSVIYQERPDIPEAWKALEKTWGPLDFLSEVSHFDYTRYYEKEMGCLLFRRWAGFRPLVGQDRLVKIKWQALDLEEQWSREGKRALNLDPGLITAERLVLATGKNYSHRLYLGKGIFGDLTLVFQKGSFRPLPWTYPDYKAENSIWMFNKIRERYLRELGRHCV